MAVYYLRIIDYLKPELQKGTTHLSGGRKYNVAIDFNDTIQLFSREMLSDTSPKLIVDFVDINLLTVSAARDLIVLTSESDITVLINSSSHTKQLLHLICPTIITPYAIWTIDARNSDRSEGGDIDVDLIGSLTGKADDIMPLFIERESLSMREVCNILNEPVSSTFLNLFRRLLKMKMLVKLDDKKSQTDWDALYAANYRLFLPYLEEKKLLQKRNN